METLADTEIRRRSGCSAGSDRRLCPTPPPDDADCLRLPDTREFVVGGRLPTRPHVLEA
jgi:hypothetical protein